MIFETHAHYDDKMFDEDRESLLESMQEAGIGRIVNIGADLASTASSHCPCGKISCLFMRQQVCIQVMPPS